MLMKLKEFVGSKFNVYFYDDKCEYEIQCAVDEWENWFTEGKYDVYIGVERKSYDPDSLCRVVAKVFKGVDPVPGYDFLYRTDTWEELKSNSISVQIV